MPKVNGSGEAYQNWNSAHASATVKITLAVTPAGFRAPVSALATSSCSASGAFSMSVAMPVTSRRGCLPNNGAWSGARRRVRRSLRTLALPSIPVQRTARGPSPGGSVRYLIQPFSR